MNRPLLLDLFCGAGGAAMGYHRAGFDVVGVDIAPQPHYPFEFHQGDALDVLDDLAHDFDAIHASPPCPAYSRVTGFGGVGAHKKHPDLVEPTRRLLEATGLPYAIENVPGAPLRPDLTLCGEMFGLRVHRHRVFEFGGGMFALRLPHTKHRLKGARDNCHIEDGYTRVVTGHLSDVDDAAAAMGIDWMTRDELTQAIPPAYTEWIGAQLLQHVRAAA
jgi:DNA (cytosine-5)-methyltransferase 1